MKTKFEPLDKTYNKCVAEGHIKPKDKVDKDLVESLVESAEQALQRLETQGNSFEKKTKNYAFLLREHYEIMRTLMDAFLCFDKKNISNHQCSNAYLCTKHQKLEFDWGILETMRILRNAVNYKGQKISLEQWNSVKMQFKIYIRSLLKLIKEKLSKGNNS